MQPVTSYSSSRHLLLISHFFPPMGGGGVQRVTKFVKYLDRYGWRTTVISGRPEDYWIRDDSLLRELPASTRIVRTAAASGLSLLRRVGSHDSGGRRSARGFGFLRSAGAWFLMPDTYIGWRPFALRAARKVIAEDPPHALMSSGPPETNHLVALQLRQQADVPWLADFRDPWFGLHLLPAPTALHRARHAQLEHRILANADCIVTTTASLGDLLRRRAASAADRLHVIRNGYDPEDFPPHVDERILSASGPQDSEESVQVTERSVPPRPVLHLVHTGMLAFTRSAAPLLYGLRELFGNAPENRGRIRVEFLGARESSNDDLVSKLGVDDCVELKGNVPHPVAIESMLAADVLVLIQYPSGRYRDLVPGKLYEYLGAGRPILALVPDSEAADLIRNLGCGEVVAPDDPGAVARALAVLLERKRAGSLRQAYPCQRHPQFERPGQARRLAELLDALSSHPTTG